MLALTLLVFKYHKGEEGISHAVSQQCLCGNRCLLSGVLYVCILYILAILLLAEQECLPRSCKHHYNNSNGTYYSGKDEKA